MTAPLSPYPLNAAEGVGVGSVLDYVAHPSKILKAAGIPTPGHIAKKLGLPAPGHLVNELHKDIVNPKHLISQIPGLKAVAKYVPEVPDPVVLATKLGNAVASGDLKAIEHTVLEVGHQAADIIAMVPGAGNVIGGPLAAALTLLETGSALKAALRMLLGQVPGIPPQIRSILGTTFDGIAEIVEKGKTVTDVVLVEFKKGVITQVQKIGLPASVSGLVNNVLDGAIQVIFHHKPLDHAALDLAENGLKTAATRVGASDPEVVRLHKTVKDLKAVYRKADEAHTLTQSALKLTKQDPGKKDPVVQRMLADVHAARAGSAAEAAAHAHQVAPTAAKAAAVSAAHTRLRAAVAKATKAAAPTHAAARAAAPTHAAAKAAAPTHAAAKAAAPTHAAARAAAPTHASPGRRVLGPYPPPEVMAGGRLSGCGGVAEGEGLLWGPPIDMPPRMFQAARMAIGASRGKPSRVLGPDGVTYLFAIENGVLTARAQTETPVVGGAFTVQAARAS